MELTYRSAIREFYMTPAQQAKGQGIKSLALVTKKTGVSRQTLANWAKNKPELFRVVLKGCKDE